MSHLDLAGAAEARKHTHRRVVTVAIDKVEFIAPVFVGERVSFYTELVRVGRTSMTVAIHVEVERADGSGCVKVTEAQAVYVAVDAEGNPIPPGKWSNAWVLVKKNGKWLMAEMVQWRIPE